MTKVKSQCPRPNPGGEETIPSDPDPVAIGPPAHHRHFKEQRPDILAAGCEEVVYKPFRGHEIFETMARLLDIEYLYEEKGKEMTPPAKIHLTAEMLAGLPGELLQELRETTLALNKEAALEVIVRVADRAPEVVAGLREFVNNYQMAELLDLLEELEGKD